MHDKRVQKGNTYAAMVIPAGAYPDTFGSTGKDATNKSQTMKSTFKQVNKVRKSVHIFQFYRNCHTDSRFRMEKWEKCLNTQTETSHPLSLFTAESTLNAKPTTNPRNWQTNQNRERRVSQLSSILIVHQCPFSSLGCLPRKTVNLPKSTTVITSSSILTKKLSRC